MRTPGQSNYCCNRAISPVIGLVLLVAIVVVLAGVLASLALGFDSELREPAPPGGFEQQYVSDGNGNTDSRPYVTITHQIGRTVDADRVYIKDESGNRVYWDDIWTGGSEVKAGEYVHIDGFASDSALDPICEAGDTYWVVLENGDGQTLITNEWTAPSDPDISAPTHDDDDDGIPNWCPSE